MEFDSKQNLGSMTIDDLLELRELVQGILREGLKTRKAELDRRLQVLAPASTVVEPTKKLGRRRVKDAHA
jgi:hypothetical protein